MQSPANSWNAILGSNNAKKAAVQYQRLLDTGSPLDPKPDFVSETEGLPYELIVTDEEPLCIAGLMKFNAEEAEWECLGVEALAREGVVSEWEIAGADKEAADKLQGTPPTELKLIDAAGKKISAECLPYVAMRNALAKGSKFLFGFHLLAHNLTREEEKQIVRDVAHKTKATPGSKPEELPFVEIDLTHARAFLQDDNTPDSDFITRVEEVTPITFCNVKGYKLRCLLSAENESEFAVDLYAFAPVLGKYIPKKGDFISGYGRLHAFPVEKVVPDAHSEETVFRNMQGDPRNMEAALDYLNNHEELPLPVRVILSTFIRTGWEILETGSKYYSKMLPAFVARKKGGDTYAVYVDAQMEGHYSFPDLNAAEIQEIKKRCKSVGYKDIRFRATVRPSEDLYSVSIAPTGSGNTPFKVSFLVDIKKPKKQISDDETVKEAALAFAETVNNSDMKLLAPYLSEELLFESKSLGTRIMGKITFLRYFTIALIKWMQNQLTPEAVVGSVEWNNKREICMALLSEGEAKACTIFRAENGYITHMQTLSEEACKTFRQA